MRIISAAGKAWLLLVNRFDPHANGIATLTAEAIIVYLDIHPDAVHYRRHTSIEIVIQSKRRPGSGSYFRIALARRPKASGTRLNPAHDSLGGGKLRDILPTFFRSPRVATSARAAFYSNQGFRDNRARIVCRNSADFARPRIGPSARSATNPA